MATIKEIRWQLKKIQTDLDKSRNTLRAKKVELDSLETQVAMLTRERDRLNGELISALLGKSKGETE